jgi:hypothetical protein
MLAVPIKSGSSRLQGKSRDPYDWSHDKDEYDIGRLWRKLEGES